MQAAANELKAFAGEREVEMRSLCETQSEKATEDLKTIQLCFGLSQTDDDLEEFQQYIEKLPGVKNACISRGQIIFEDL